MKKLFCVTCGKYRKLKNSKSCYNLGKAIVLSFICRKCENEDEKTYNYFKNAVKESISQEF